MKLFNMDNIHYIDSADIQPYTDHLKSKFIDWLEEVVYYDDNGNLVMHFNTIEDMVKDFKNQVN